jgi:hypothetical protein
MTTGRPECFTESHFSHPGRKTLYPAARAGALVALGKPGPKLWAFRCELPKLRLGQRVRALLNLDEGTIDRRASLLSVGPVLLACLAHIPMTTGLP